MPYIKEAAREKILTKHIDDRCVSHQIQIDHIQTAGELNYAITEIIKSYFERKSGNYQAINDVVGALEGAKIEFYRRVAVPYEDEKIEENGDVYP